MEIPLLFLFTVKSSSRTEIFKKGVNPEDIKWFGIYHSMFFNTYKMAHVSTDEAVLFILWYNLGCLFNNVSWVSFHINARPV